MYDDALMEGLCVKCGATRAQWFTKGGLCDTCDERRIREEEAAHHREVTLYAHFCPKCGQDCGDPDFEPDDPTVGIFSVLWANECPEHGLFTVYDDGDLEFENDGRPA